MGKYHWGSIVKAFLNGTKVLVLPFSEACRDFSRQFVDTLICLMTPYRGSKAVLHLSPYKVDLYLWGHRTSIK